MAELGIGIISGLLASSIVFIFTYLYKQAVRPWFENKVYKDIRIEGTWKIMYQNVSEPVEEHAYLERTAHAVKGTITAVKGPDAGKSYTVSGEYKNSILVLSYSATDKSALDRGAFVLLIAGNGEKFKGQSAYYYDNHEIITRPVEWNRLNNK